jgi:hypothetical protein
MKKEITEIKDNILRITSLNERWYAKPSKDVITGLPCYDYKPSSTWIAGYYPKGIAFYQWLAKHGWNEAEALKQAAGDKGSKVHYACESLDKDNKVDIEKDKYLNPTTEKEEELTPEEIECVVSYARFIDDKFPKLLASEITAFGDFYAGTIDKIVRIGTQIWIIDLKTSKYIWEEQKLQISSYSHLDIDYKKLGITDKEWKERKLGILQLGYNKNKMGYKFTEVENKFDMFKNVAYKIWQNENPRAKPKEIELPLIIKSKFREEELKAKKKNNKVK